MDASKTPVPHVWSFPKTRAMTSMDINVRAWILSITWKKINSIAHGVADRIRHYNMNEAIRVHCSTFQNCTGVRYVNGQK